MKSGETRGEMPDQLANRPFILQATVNVRPEAFDPVFLTEKIPNRMPNNSIVYKLQPFFGEQCQNIYSK